METCAINIPSLPTGKFFDKETGDILDNYRQFFDQLVKVLQQNAGQEGLIAPTQTASNITIIQNNRLANGSYTTPGACFLYDGTNDLVKVSILAAGIPSFKTVMTS